MKNWRKFLVFLGGMTLFSCGTWAGAFEAKSTFFQGSFFTPAELYSANAEVTGLRLTMVYGNNQKITGADIGICGVTGQATGTQLGAVNVIKSKMAGSQIGCCNFVGSEDPLQKSTAAGAQLGWVNVSKAAFVGTQIGATNLSDNGFNGIQFGVVNCVGESAAPAGCLQIGVLNFNKDGFLPFFVLFNYR